MPPTLERLTGRDYLGLAAFCVALYGISLLGIRPLTMHEGVLPQTAQEMLADRDWLVPKIGGRPWLESPPLPQWITVSIASLFGRCDSLAIVRIGPLLMGTACVLLVAWMASVWYGRTHALVAGLVYATMYEIVQYSWLSEDEIFLCALVTLAVACFVRLEFAATGEEASPTNNPDASVTSTLVPAIRGFFSARPWGVLVLFIALGMTNLAKGLLFGTVMAAVPMAGFLLWNADRRRIGRYLWFWGFAAFAIVALAWPMSVIARIPDAVDIWKYDHVGRLDGEYVALTKPFWYYAKVLPGEIAPWTPVALLGLCLTARTAFRTRYSPERFLWCWAILTPVVFSLPTGKNHHYLLHCLAPWAVLSVPGLVWLRTQIVQAPRTSAWWNLLVWGGPGVVALWLFGDRLRGPEWLVPCLCLVWPAWVLLLSWGLPHANARYAAAVVFGSVAVGYVAGHGYAGWYADLCRDDTRFLQQVAEAADPDRPLLIDGHTESLDEFRLKFYLPARAALLHNLSFVADERFRGEEAYVVARLGAKQQLEEFGSASVVLQSAKTRREKSVADRWTLFRLRYRDDVAWQSSTGVRFSPMQVMQRAEGPFLQTAGRDDAATRR